MNILTINLGLTSLKFKIFAIGKHDKLNLLLVAQVTQITGKSAQVIVKNLIKNNVFKEQITLDGDFHLEVMKHILSNNSFNQFDVNIVINKISYGGDEYKSITLLHKKTIVQLSSYNHLAPDYQPQELALANFLMQKLPKAKHYGYFDTMFHQSIPLINKIYAIPLKYVNAGVRRYGMHGASYRYLSSRLDAIVDSKLLRRKWILAHLGSSSSICAIKNKKSYATSSGFSAIGNPIPMPNRCGGIDMDIPDYLMTKYNLSQIELNEILNQQSGLLGLSNDISNNIKDLILSNDKNAKFAIDYYCLQVAANIAQLVVMVGGIDGIIFSGGVGENSSLIRFKIIELLEFIGVEISQKANNANKIKIHKKNSKIPVLVIATNEEEAMLTEFINR